MLLSAIPLIFGFLLDLLLGDPHWMPHPVRLIGKGIAWGEKLLRQTLPSTPRCERVGGVLLTGGITLGSLLLPWGLLLLCGAIHPLLRLVVETVMCYQILAVKSLRVESMRVYSALRAGDTEGARQAVSMIVGRDTQFLTPEEIAKAAVETVAENTADGVVAPLCFMALGGAPLGFFYKAVNTLDSMIGYRSDRYLQFGRFAAKLDDGANFLPARLAGLLMILSAGLVGLDASGSLRIFRRDRHKHASPNSGQTEAACAGALGLCLGGDASYFGTVHHKPTMGDPLRPAEPLDIVRANRLMYGTATLSWLFAVMVRMVWMTII